MTAFLLVLVFLPVALIVVYWTTISFLFAEEVRADEVHMVTTGDGWQIRLCRYRPAEQEGEPVFLCHGAMGNQFNFTSPQGDSLVDCLVEEGYDCWAIDLRGDRSSEAPAGRSRYTACVDEFLLEDIPAAIDYIREKTGHSQVHWVGHSLGGMLLYAYELAHGLENVASATTLGSPPGFDGVHIAHPRRLLKLLDAVPGVVECLARAFSIFLPLLKPKLSFAPINWENMHPNAGAATFFNLIEILPPKVAEELASWAAHGEWRMKNGEIDVLEGLKNLQMPLFAIYGQADPVVPIKRARAFFEALPAKDKQILVLSKVNGHSADYNHVDLTFARNGREEVYRPIAQWLDAHPVAHPVVQPVAQPAIAPDSAGEKAMHAGQSPGKTPGVPAKTKVLLKKPAAKGVKTVKTGAKRKMPGKKKPVVKKRVKKKAATKEITTKKAPAKQRPKNAKKTTIKKSATKKPVAKKRPAKKAKTRKRSAR